MGAIVCPCPVTPGGERHPDGDTVTFKPRLGFVEAAAIRNRVQLYRAEAGEDLDADETLAVLTEGYLLHGIESWTLEGEDGKPLPVTKANIRDRILGNWSVAAGLADEADDLYAEAVMLPLLARASTSSRPSPTPQSTSPSNGTGTPVPKPSRRSLISTLPTDDIETTSSSPDGDSRSSQSATTAA